MHSPRKIRISGKTLGLGPVVLDLRPAIYPGLSH